MSEPAPLASRAYFPFLDYIRVIACFLVILLHVSATIFYQFSPAWTICVIYEGISRMSVPLFFMLSGFLLFESDISSLGRFYYKRYIRIFIPFATVCFFYYFTPLYDGYSPLQYIWRICNYYVDYHLWYIYILVGIYLSLPFFIKMFSGEQGMKFVRVYLGIWISAFVIGTYALRYFEPERDIFNAWNLVYPNGGLEYLLYDMAPNVFINFNFAFFYGFMGYLVCGWLVRRHLARITPLWAWGCILLSILASIGIIYCTHEYSHSLNEPNELFFENLNPLVFLQAVPFFMACVLLRRRHRIIAELADKSFWIYLMHLIILRIIYGLCPVPKDWSAAWVIPGAGLLVFSIAYLVAIPLRAFENLLLSLLNRFVKC